MNMPSRPCFLEVYPVSGLVLLLVILQWNFGTHWSIWCHFPVTRPYPSAHPQVIGLFVPVPLEGDDLMWLLPVSCSCVLLLVFQMLPKTWRVLSNFLCIGSNRKLPSGHLSLGQLLFLSFFLSFLLILVIGAPQHEKEKHKRDEKVGGIDRYEG